MTDPPDRKSLVEQRGPEARDARDPRTTGRRRFFSALNGGATRDQPPARRSKLFPDLPPFEEIPEVPDDHPRVQWLPPGYRRAYVARGANSGFQVADDIGRVFAHPKIEGGGQRAMQVYSTHTAEARLAGTHLNGNPGPARRTSLAVAGHPVEAQYYDGQFTRSGHGTYVSERGARFRWSRENQHSLVLTVQGLKVGIRASRMGGVEEFHLYAIAESLRLPRGLA